MTGIALLLFAAAGGMGLARWTGFPTVPCLILGGILVGALSPLPVEFIQDALLLGLTVLVFVAGIEMSPGRIRQQRAVALRVGLLQFLLLGGIGFGGALLLGYPPETAAFLALALTASSTLVVVRLLQSRQQFFEPFGRMVTGVLLLQDFLVILSIPILTRLPQGWGWVGMGVLGTMLLALLARAFLLFGAPLLVRRVADDEELLLLSVLSVLFSFLGIAHLFELPIVSGAFFAGIALSGFPLNALVRGKLTSFSDFFNALFFTALGAFLPAPSGTMVGHALLFALLVILVTPPLVALIAERSGFSARPALAAGLLLSQTSEFSLVVALAGLGTGQISIEIFGIVALVTVATMIATPFLATDRMTWALVRWHPLLRRPSPAKDPPQNHILLLGGGRNGQALLEVLLLGPDPIVLVDDDPALIALVREAGVPVVRGDASDLATLRAAGVERARIVISTIRRREDNGPLLQAAGKIPVLVRTFNEADGAWIRARGGIPILFSDAAAEDFLEWLDEESETLTAGDAYP